MKMLLGTCTHFYEYVPLEAGYSPPCDPTGVNIVLYCTGYAPTTAIDLIWMFTPDLNTPYTQAHGFFHSNWLASTSGHVVSSGPFAGLRSRASRLSIVLTGVQPDIMGYYACTYVHRSMATTPEFVLSPAVLLNATPGVTTPCPANNYLAFAEQMSPVLCAEAVVTTTPEPVTTTQEITTQTTNTTTMDTVTDGKRCCGHAAYIGVATALFTSICICVVGATAFAISEVVHRVQKKRHRKLFVGKHEGVSPCHRNIVLKLIVLIFTTDRNVIDPRNSEEHHLGIQGCKACAKLREKD